MGNKRETDSIVEKASIRGFIGRRIRSLRIERGMTQERMAELSGLHPTYIGHIERGEKNISIDCVSRIASALDTTLQDLFQDAEKASVPFDDPLSTLYDKLSSLRPEVRDEVCEIMRRILALRR